MDLDFVTENSQPSFPPSPSSQTQVVPNTQNDFSPPLSNRDGVRRRSEGAEIPYPLTDGTERAEGAAALLSLNFDVGNLIELPAEKRDAGLQSAQDAFSNYFGNIQVNAGQAQRLVDQVLNLTKRVFEKTDQLLREKMSLLEERDKALGDKEQQLQSELKEADKEDTGAVLEKTQALLGVTQQRQANLKEMGKETIRKLAFVEAQKEANELDRRRLRLFQSFLEEMREERMRAREAAHKREDEERKRKRDEEDTAFNKFVQNGLDLTNLIMGDKDEDKLDDFIAPDQKHTKKKARKSTPEDIGKANEFLEQHNSHIWIDIVEFCKPLENSEAFKKTYFDKNNKFKSQELLREFFDKEHNVLYDDLDSALTRSLSQYVSIKVRQVFGKKKRDN